jgi:hypothetical protein
MRSVVGCENLPQLNAFLGFAGGCWQSDATNYNM